MQSVILPKTCKIFGILRKLNEQLINEYLYAELLILRKYGNPALKKK